MPVFYILNDLLLCLQHGAAVIDDKMYIFGGNHNGRYIGDLQVREICPSACFLLSSLVFLNLQIELLQLLSKLVEDQDIVDQGLSIC